MKILEFTTVHLALLCVYLCAGCGGDVHDHDGHDHGGEGHGEEGHNHEVGPNGGELYELGDHEGHMELVRDADTGALTLNLFQEDNETGLVVARAPELKLVTPEGPKLLVTEAVGGTDEGASVFAVTDLGELALEGRVSVYVGEKTFNPELRP